MVTVRLLVRPKIIIIRWFKIKVEFQSHKEAKEAKEAKESDF
jgi:hypothetical protein